MSFNSIYFWDLTCFKTFDLKLNSFSFHSAATNYITPNHSYEWKLIKNVISVKLDSYRVHMDTLVMSVVCAGVLPSYGELFHR